jgi:hypothetical protein
MVADSGVVSELGRTTACGDDGVKVDGSSHRLCKPARRRCEVTRSQEEVSWQGPPGMKLTGGRFKGSRPAGHGCSPAVAGLD